MDQWNKEPRDKPSYIWSNDFQLGCQYHSMGKGQSFQQRVWGKLDIDLQMNEIGPLFYTI